MQQKSCSQCFAEFPISALELEFLDSMSPVISGIRYPIPTPSLCPTCRMQRRMAQRNQLFVNMLDTGVNKKLFTMYLGIPNFPVLSNEEWWDEKTWNPEDYGREFDFTRPFFDQFKELRDQVPRPALNAVSGTIHNSEYCNNCIELKNCYFCFDADRLQDCMYCETIADSVDCLDCSVMHRSELCYDCVSCNACYNLQSSEGCVDCSDSFFLQNCRSCKNCFGCANLRHKEYCIFNKQVSQEEYRRYISTLNLSSWIERSRVKEQVLQFFSTQARPHLIGSRFENSSGNHIYNSRNVSNSFFVYNSEDIANSLIVKVNAKNCHDCTIWCESSQWLYECAICGLNAFRLAFCYNCWDGAQELLYCDTSHGSQFCFGSVCLRKREFCILNRRYSREDYFSLLPKIIKHMTETGEWGEYFPMHISPWPYNTSFASRYFPISEEEAKSRGLDWLTVDTQKSPIGQAVEDLPDGLPESEHPIIVNSMLSGRAFKITSEEIKRYKRLNVPLPRLSYDERMNQRSLACGNVHLKPRLCDKTGVEIETVYSRADAPVLWTKESFDEEFQ